MHCCCAVDAIDGGGVIAGLGVFAVEAGGRSLAMSWCETGRFAVGFRWFRAVSMTRRAQGDSAVPFYLRVF